jgi:hypothetical protein
MKPCMEPHEAAEWERLNMILPEKNRAAEPCEDCTIRFAVEMRLAGRCTGWPPTETRPPLWTTSWTPPVRRGTLSA